MAFMVIKTYILCILTVLHVCKYGIYKSFHSRTLDDLELLFSTVVVNTVCAKIDASCSINLKTQIIYLLLSH